MDWPSGLGGVEGRGRASTHGAFWVGCKSSILNRIKIIDFAFFWGREGGVPGRGRQRRELGAGWVVRSRAQGAGVVGVQGRRDRGKGVGGGS